MTFSSQAASPRTWSSPPSCGTPVSSIQLKKGRKSVHSILTPVSWVTAWTSYVTYLGLLETDTILPVQKNTPEEYSNGHRNDNAVYVTNKQTATIVPGLLVLFLTSCYCSWPPATIVPGLLVLFLTSCYCSWPLGTVPDLLILLFLVSWYCSWTPATIVLGLLVLFLNSCYYCFWPLGIVPDLLLLFLASWYYSWPPATIAPGLLVLFLTSCYCSWPLGTFPDLLLLLLKKSPCMICEIFMLPQHLYLIKECQGRLVVSFRKTCYVDFLNIKLLSLLV